MISPYKANISEDWAITAGERTNIVEMVENWGVEFSDKIAADVSCARILMISDDQSETKSMNYYLWPSVLSQKNAPLGATLFWPVQLKLSKNAQPYLTSSNFSFNFEPDKSSPQSLIQTNPFLIESINLSDKEKKSQVFAAEIKGKIEGLYNDISVDNSHIIVIPDQYFVNSLMTSYIGGETGDYRNFEVLTNALLKINGEEELSQIHSKISRDTSLYKVSSNLDLESKKKLTYLLLFLLYPLLILICGVMQNVKIKK